MLATVVLDGVVDFRLDEARNDVDEDEILVFKDVFSDEVVVLSVNKTLAGSIAPISPKQEPNLINF